MIQVSERGRDAKTYHKLTFLAGKSVASLDDLSRNLVNEDSLLSGLQSFQCSFFRYALELRVLDGKTVEFLTDSTCECSMFCDHVSKCRPSSREMNVLGIVLRT